MVELTLKVTSPHGRHSWFDVAFIQPGGRAINLQNLKTAAPEKFENLKEQGAKAVENQANREVKYQEHSTYSMQFG